MGHLEATIKHLTEKVLAMSEATIQFPEEKGLKEDLEYFRALLRRAENGDAQVLWL